MGIPHLISTLEPYADHGHLDHQKVVIDGPALAYHILYKCNAGGISHPSYDLLGRATCAWMEQLSKCFVTVEAVYFDGHLPIEKRPVRMERLAKTTKRIQNFFSTHATSLSRRHLPHRGTKVPSLFGSGRAEHSSLPAPSFLVPAVIDTLSTSVRYRHLVRLVPGEADAYSANHVALSGGIVLTSDSDLLAHDLAGGKVAFLREIHLDASSRLACAIFDPAQISSRLQLPLGIDSCRFAFERVSDPHASLSQIIKRCSRPAEPEAEYEAFRRPYLLQDDVTQDPSAQNSLAELHGLDPRLSEVVVQLASYLPVTTREKPEIPIQVFLPTLMENPSRGSAWEPSTPIRQLAYSISAYSGSNSPVLIQEYRRVQSLTQKGRTVDLLPIEHVNQGIHDMMNIMTRLRRSVRGQDPYWTLVSIALDIHACEEQDKQGNVLRIMQDSSQPSGSASNHVSWDAVHLLAHVHASLYSFRMLRQILSRRANTGADSQLAKPDELNESLSSLPDLAHFPDIEDILALLGAAGRTRALAALQDVVNIPPPPPPPPPPTSSGLPAAKGVHRKKRKRKQSSTETPSENGVARGTTQNRFTLLDME